MNFQFYNLFRWTKLDKFIYQLWLCLQSAQTQLVNICQGEPPDKDRERQRERDIETDRDREKQCNAMQCTAMLYIIGPTWAPEYQCCGLCPVVDMWPHCDTPPALPTCQWAGAHHVSLCGALGLQVTPHSSLLTPHSSPTRLVLTGREEEGVIYYGDEWAIYISIRQNSE